MTLRNAGPEWERSPAPPSAGHATWNEHTHLQMPHPSPGRAPAHCLVRRAESTHGRGFWSQEDTGGHLSSDCAWSRGSRDQQTGCPGDPWIPATHQGRVDPGSLLDLKDSREIRFLSYKQARLSTTSTSLVPPQLLPSASHLEMFYTHGARCKAEAHKLSPMNKYVKI